MWATCNVACVNYREGNNDDAVDGYVVIAGVTQLVIIILYKYIVDDVTGRDVHSRPFTP